MRGISSDIVFLFVGARWWAHQGERRGVPRTAVTLKTCMSIVLIDHAVGDRRHKVLPRRDIPLSAGERV
ncbi:hypothetical protein CFH99_04005 [Nocardioides aromaticivorans]|uniref:Uncharacterized protein n=1 Tax=Nocardioides aromaticivorans TaxID=200618 RepID=A0ABX7PG55_9ACTN|nr:hypothetical protein CFH99_04005 [Nocardioides aromaticivorans]